MSTEIEKSPAKPTGRKYASVSALLRGEGASQEVINKVSEYVTESRVALQLAKLRQIAGITQEQMANRLGVTQGTISKLECGCDEDITLKNIRDYARETNERIGVSFGRRLRHAEAIKMHAGGLKNHLEALAEIANQNDDLQSQIKNFFGQAFFNLFNIMASCNEKLPCGDDGDVQITIEVVKVSMNQDTQSALRSDKMKEAAV